MAEVFISYSRKDKDFVKRLSEALAKLDQKPWVDWKDIPPTAEWKQEIFAAIEAADAFVLVISPEYLASEVCQQEIAHALECHKRLIPLVYREVDAKAAPEAVAKRNWIFFRESDDFEASVKSLLEAIDTDLDWVRAHTRFLTRAIEWDSEGRDKGSLLGGKDLREAEQWLAQSGQKEPQPTTLQAQYISASRQASTSRQVWLAFGLGVLAMVILVAIYIYFQKKNTDQVALSRQLAAQSQTLLRTQFDLGLLLSVKANQEVNTVESQGSILEALVYQPQLIRFLHHPFKSVFLTLALSSDGKTLAAGSLDGKIMLWDWASGKALGNPLNGQNQPLTSLALNDKNLVAGYEDGTLMWWNLANQPLRPISLKGHPRRVNDVAFSPKDQNLMVSGEMDNLLQWNLDSPNPQGVPFPKELPLFSLVQNNPPDKLWFVQSLAFSPDGEFLASSNSSEIILWNIKDRQPICKPIEGQYELINSLDFMKDKRILASGSPKTIILRDLSNPEIPHLISKIKSSEHKDDLESVAFSPDGKTMASSSKDQTVLLWNVTDPVNPKQLGDAIRVNRIVVGTKSDYFQLKPYSRTLVFPNDNTLALANYDSTVILWGLTERRRLSESLKRHQKGVNSVAFNPKNLSMLASGSTDQSMMIWDIANRSEIKIKTLQGHTGDVTSIAFRPDGKRLATASNDNTIRLWEVSDPNNPQIFKVFKMGEHETIRSVAYSGDGSLIASVRGAHDIILLELNADDTVKTAKSFYHRNVQVVAISPTSNILASGGDHVILWDLADPGNPKELGVLKSHEDGVESLVFSGDGEILASGGRDGKIFFWDMAQRQQIGAPLTGHTDNVASVSFSPDGRTLASGSWDKTIRLWGVASHRQIGPALADHTGYVRSVAFSPEGKTMASGSDDTTIKLWDVDPESWKAKALAIANRELTEGERQQYLGD